MLSARVAGMLVGLVSRARLEGLVRTAAEESLWPEVLDLLTHLSDRLCAELADVASEQDDTVLDSLVACAQQLEMWDVVLPLARLMNEPNRRRFASLPSIHDEQVLEAIVRVSAQRELWAEIRSAAREPIN